MYVTCKFFTYDLIRQSNRTFNRFLSDFVEITSCVYTKTINLFNSVNNGFRDIYLAASRRGEYLATIHLDSMQ